MQEPDDKAEKTFDGSHFWAKAATLKEAFLDSWRLRRDERWGEGESWGDQKSEGLAAVRSEDAIDDEQTSSGELFLQDKANATDEASKGFVKSNAEYLRNEAECLESSKRKRTSRGPGRAGPICHQKPLHMRY